MKGKTVLITGATSGIGKISALKFAKLGADLLIHGRSKEKISSTIEEIKKESGNQNVKGYLADLSNLHEVRSLTKEILSDNEKIDVLINNAGFLGKTDDKKILSTNGFELIFHINYLALVLITEGLLPLIKKANGRIINVSSAAQTELDLDNLMASQGMTAYAHSKLAVILYSFHLAKRVLNDSVSVFALDPGSLLNTNMVQNAFGASDRSPEIGADAHILLATSQDLKSGSFFCEQNEAKAHDQAYDEQAQEKLWEKTQSLLKDFIER